MDEAAAALVPPWLEPMLRASYFAACRIHANAARSECNMFCIDCPSASAFCFYCRSSSHSAHRTVQIRRSSYHDVVRVAEVQRLLDISGVQTYVINSARVMFLNERPQPRGGGAGSSGTAGGKLTGGSQICEICYRTLLDPFFRFCSLGCKLEAIKRNGDACFIPEDVADDEADVDVSKPLSRAGGEETGDGRRRRRRAKLTAASPGSGQKQPPSPPPPPPAPSTTGHRRRKGVPHRSPLAS